MGFIADLWIAKLTLPELGELLANYRRGASPWMLDIRYKYRYGMILWMEEILHQLVTIGNYKTL